jgi:hypothetical protein
MAAERDAVGHHARRAAGGDQRDEPGDEIRPFVPGDLWRVRTLALDVFQEGHEIEGGAVDVDVAAAVDDDLVEAAGQAAQVGMGDQRPVGLPAQETLRARRICRHDQLASIR